MVTLTAIGFLAYVSRLILKRRLKEEYAIIWFVSTFLLALLSFRSDLLDTVAVLLGVAFAPNLLFAGVIFIVMEPLDLGNTIFPHMSATVELPLV